MNCRDICHQAGDVYLNFAFPERVLARSLGGRAKRYPKVAMGVEVTLAVFLGVAKLLILPLASLSGIILFPLRGLIQVFSTGKLSSATPYLLASLIALFVSAILVAALFCTILIAPEVVFIMVGVLGALFMSTSLLQMHEELFAPRDQEVPLIEEKSLVQEQTTVNQS